MYRYHAVNECIDILHAVNRCTSMWEGGDVSICERVEMYRYVGARRSISMWEVGDVSVCGR